MNPTELAVVLGVLVFSFCVASGGRAAAPALKSRVFLGQQSTYVVISPDRSGGACELGVKPERPKVLWDAPKRAAWGLQRAFLDVMGDGKLQDTPWSAGDRWVPSFTGGKGIQRLNWTSSWAEKGKLRLYSYEDGLEKPRLVWETEEEPAYSPLTVAGDFDGDGKPEVAVSRWGGVSIYDGTTGKRKAVLDYRKLDAHPNHARPYGFFGAYPMPSGKGTYFVEVADFVPHIEVLAYEDGAPRLLWMYIIYFSDPGFSGPPDSDLVRHVGILRVVPDPVADFDGDGRQEILVTVYDYQNDQRWHILGYDLLTGEITLDIPDRYLAGIADVDGDGKKELFCQTLTTRAEPTYTPLELLQLRKGEKPRVLWKTERGRWDFRETSDQPINVLSTQLFGNRKLALGRNEQGTEFFVTLPGDAGERVEAWRVSKDGAAHRVWEAAANEKTELEVVAISPDGSQALALGRSRAKAEVRFHEGGGEVASSSQRDYCAPYAAIAKDAQGKSWAFAADITRHVSLLQLDGGLKAVKEFPGRAMTILGEGVNQGLGVADLDGDGAEECLFAQETPGGPGARLLAMGVDGKERWHADFANHSGRMRAWNMGGISYWKAGHFRGRDKLDLAISFRRATGETCETYLVDGKTGKILWQRFYLELPDKRRVGYGGMPMVAVDLNGDGRDELVMWGWRGLSVADGATGDIIAAHSTAPFAEVEDLWADGGTPIIADLDGDGKPEILCAGHPTLLFAFKFEEGKLKPFWHAEPKKGTQGLPALVKLAGGECVIGAAGFSDGFHAIDGKDGKTRWTAALTGATVSNTVAADIEGAPTFIFAVGDQLHARRAADGAEVWSVKLPSPATQILYVPDGKGLLVSVQSGELLAYEM